MVQCHAASPAIRTHIPQPSRMIVTASQPGIFRRWADLSCSHIIRVAIQAHHLLTQGHIPPAHSHVVTARQQVHLVTAEAGDVGGALVHLEVT
jgi:hypothetical protein